MHGTLNREDALTDAEYDRLVRVAEEAAHQMLVHSLAEGYTFIEIHWSLKPGGGRLVHIVNDMTKPIFDGVLADGRQSGLIKKVL